MPYSAYLGDATVFALPGFAWMQRGRKDLHVCERRMKRNETLEDKKEILCSFLVPAWPA
jgi:hypothetical protein